MRGIGINFIELEIPANSPALGRPVRELDLPDDSILPLLIRSGTKTIIPSGNTVLEPADQVIAVTSETSEGILRRILLGYNS